MAKDQDFRNRFGANLAESMGANRVSGAGGPTADDKPDRLDGTERLRAAATIEVERIIPDPDQPRKEFDEDAIDRLAASLNEHGQIQPIAVRWSESMGRYLIVSGERRWRASVKAGRKTIAAVIVEGDRTDSQILEMQLVENCLREDLQPIEQARAFRTLMARNGWPALRLAQALHMSESTIIKALALLTLPCTVQDRVEAGELAPSVAYEVSKLQDSDDQAEVAARVVAEGLSRAETARRSGRPPVGPRRRPGRAGGQSPGRSPSVSSGPSRAPRSRSSSSEGSTADRCGLLWPRLWPGSTPSWSATRSRPDSPCTPGMHRGWLLHPRIGIQKTDVFADGDFGGQTLQNKQF
ncbi:ParB/RepB/Spo0J family partition protein (plasmid) [Tundrisphaera lichenicola]|uniref:ParB/RepB/Spo0J family partition protein n=1 Tax=Tundrisphaera lichenicola TaxID=2029860 RepID=UPI003EC0AB96